MINIFEPNIGDKSLELLSDVFKSKWLGKGKYVDIFEKEFHELLGYKSGGITTISCCTDGIFGVYDIFDFKDGDEVIIPSISFPAIGSSCLAKRLKPKIVDIDPLTGNISYGALAEALTTETKAVFITHYGGIPVDIEKIKEIVGDGVLIFEDAACALGSTYNGSACGTLGDFGCWSFDAMKLITCGEGGAIYFRDPFFLNKARQYFYLGLPLQSKSGIDRSNSTSRWWEYNVEMPGRRSIFTNVNAAIGIPEIRVVNESLNRRQIIRNYYESELKQLGVDMLKQDDPAAKYSNYFCTVVSEKRDALALHLKARDVYATFRYYPLHRIQLFKPYSLNCTNADWFCENALNIPIHQALTDNDVEHIVKTIKEFY
jgi:dTDP-4-amino-4,6-dideoxygalactose transaminase